MFQELKKRVNLAFISQLGIAFVIFPLLVAIWKGGFAQELITKARACFQEPIEINPGEDLSQYANQNVRCTFKYVINSVVIFTFFTIITLLIIS